MNGYQIAVILVYVVFMIGTWWQYRTYSRSTRRLEQLYERDLTTEREALRVEANELIERTLALQDADVASLRAENMRLRSQVEQLQSFAKDHVIFQARECIAHETLAAMALEPADLEREIRHRLAGEFARALTQHAVMTSWDDPRYMHKVVEMRVPIASLAPDEAMEPVPSPRWTMAAMYGYPRIPPRSNPKIDEILKSANEKES